MQNRFTNMPTDGFNLSEFDSAIDTQGLQDSVLAERMRQFMGRTRVTYVAGSFTAAYMVFLHWPRVSHRLLIAWWLCLLVVDIASFVHSSWYLRQFRPVEAMQAWRVRQIALQMLAGLGWGCSMALLTLDPAGSQDRTIVLLGVSVVAVIGFMPFYASVLAFTLSIWCVPFGIYFIHGNAHDQGLALGVLIVVVALNVFLWHSSRQMLHGIQQRFESEALAHALGKAANRIYSLATRDELTGLFNRRHGMKVLRSLLQEQPGLPPSRDDLSLLLLDIDHFKRVNDTYGHPAGDEVLRQVSHRLVGGVRKSDVVARIGGEEFMVVLPATNDADACAAAQSLCQHVAESPICFGTAVLTVTVSIGVVKFEAAETIEHALARADAALYVAKNEGRNRMVRALPMV